MTAAYRPIKQLGGDNSTNAQHYGRSKGQSDQLEPVRFERSLRQRWRFDYLQPLGLLVSIQFFVQARSRKFAVCFSKSLLERLPLSLKRINIIGLCRLSFCRGLRRLREGFF